MKIAISTVVTKEYLKEFELLYFSSKNSGIHFKWYIVCNEETAPFIKALVPDAVIMVEDFSDGHQWGNSESRESFSKAINYKFNAANKALQEGLPVLMVDCDIIFINNFDETVISKMNNESLDCIVCPHMHHNPQSDAQWGVYNVGFVFVRSQDFLKRWEELSKSGKYLYEQKPMEIVLHEGGVSYEIFPFTYNLSWWRFNQQHTVNRFNDISVFNGSFRFLGSDVVALHTHIIDDSKHPQCKQFNSVVRQVFEGAENHKNILNKIDELSK